MGGLKDFQQWSVRLHRNSISTQIWAYVRQATVEQNELLQLQRLMSSFLSLFYVLYILCVCVCGVCGLCVCVVGVFLWVVVYVGVCVSEINVWWRTGVTRK